MFNIHVVSPFLLYCEKLYLFILLKLIISYKRGSKRIFMLKEIAIDDLSEGVIVDTIGIYNLKYVQALEQVV
ncbi:hypothetical protein EAI30_05575 [Romboutsia ilealis]|nr:hypothetical protein [Romboutsia ilealis]